MIKSKLLVSLSGLAILATVGGLGIFYYGGAPKSFLNTVDSSQGEILESQQRQTQQVTSSEGTKTSTAVIASGKRREEDNLRTVSNKVGLTNNKWKSTAFLTTLFD